MTTEPTAAVGHPDGASAKLPLWRHAVPRTWRVRLGLTASLGTVLLTMPSLLEVPECLPSETLPSQIFNGYCEPLPAWAIIATLITMAVLAFAVVWTVALMMWGVLSVGRRLAGRLPTQKSALDSRPRRPLRRLAGWAFTSRRARLTTAAGAVFFAGVLAGQVANGPADGRQFALIREAWDILHEHYVQPADLDPEAMAYTAIEGMTWAVGDEDHTVFLTPDQVQPFEEALSADVDPVDWTMLPDSSIALIQLEVFSDGASNQVGNMVRGANFAGATGIVLDLRGNPGGSIDEAVRVISEFVASGPAVQMRDRSGTVRVAYVDGGIVDGTTPLAVLVDGDSASAAEMVAAALQEAGRAVLIGQTTFGTGTGLASHYLADGSVLEVGEGAWLTRDGESAWRTGVEPDIRVRGSGNPLTPPQVRSATPEQLEGDVVLAAAVSWLGSRGP